MGVNFTNKSTLQLAEVYPRRRKDAFIQEVWIATYGAYMAAALQRGVDLDSAHLEAAGVADATAKRVISWNHRAGTY